jgi:hypothetical protein
MEIPTGTVERQQKGRLWNRALCRYWSAYTVQFKNDKRHGYGHSKWRDEIFNYGQWKESIREGYRFLNWQNGNEYGGEWKDNKITGVRTYK